MPEASPAKILLSFGLPARTIRGDVLAKPLKTLERLKEIEPSSSAFRHATSRLARGPQELAAGASLQRGPVPLTPAVVTLWMPYRGRPRQLRNRANLGTLGDDRPVRRNVRATVTSFSRAHRACALERDAGRRARMSSNNVIDVSSCGDACPVCRERARLQSAPMVT
jgi:hypothetical protein